MAEHCKGSAAMRHVVLLLTGGEPFIRPDFEEIYRRCRELGIIVSINTNGTMLGEKQVELLRKLPPQRVNITLYGASEATYENFAAAAVLLKEPTVRLQCSRKRVFPSRSTIL